MKNIIIFNRLIEENSQALGGVFAYSDLAAILNTSDKVLLPKKIGQLEAAGIITKFMRGVYLSQRSFDANVLSRKLFSQSYISLENVLADHLIIGTIPQFRITAVKVGRSRTYQSPSFTVEHLGLQEVLFFGFTNRDGINISDPEKALLDCLYFYQKGRRPSFNIYEDINVSRLDRARITNYLECYKNSKFVAFVQSLLRGYD